MDFNYTPELKLAISKLSTMVILNEINLSINSHYYVNFSSSHPHNQLTQLHQVAVIYFFSGTIWVIQLWRGAPIILEATLLL